MQDSFSILWNHGYVVAFVWVLVEQAGFPLPSLAVTLTAGALAHDGQLSLSATLSLTMVAALLADTFWFEVGRRRGDPVIKYACRMALEPDSCVQRTRDMFSRHGTMTLLISKLMPGMSLVAPPLAGMSGISRARFLLLNTAGSVLFAMVVVLPGYIFSSQVNQILAFASTSGGWFLTIAAALVAAYVVFKYARRKRFIRFLRVARISAEELKEKLDAGADMVIVDLRHALDFAAAPWTLPGAIRLAPNEVADRHREIPRDREIVLYCTCPDEYTSTRVALLLKRHGILQVRPLTGGYDTWLQKNFPLVPAERVRTTVTI